MLKPIDFVAEISANHLGSLERAHKLVEAAATAGATSVKFQTYKADTMTLNLEKFHVSAGHKLWGGRTLYSLYEEAHMPWEWHEELFEHCREKGVVPFSTPFDISALEFLEKLKVEKYKISSLETSDHRLIRAVAETGKPLIVSTGATELLEIEELVRIIDKAQNEKLTLLVCTSSYPAEASDSHIKRMLFLKKEFGCAVGLSDHTLGVGVSIAAIALGAEVIEKHLTIFRTDGGPDGAFSMEPNEFAQLVEEGNKARRSLGEEKWIVLKSENESRRLRRSLFIVKDVKKGEIVSFENVKALRPGDGMHPRFLERIVGKKFKSNYECGTPLEIDHIN